MTRDATPSGTLNFAELTMYPDERRVDNGGCPVSLTGREFDVLELFLRQPKHVISPYRFLEPGAGARPNATRNGFERTLSNLRCKLEADGRPRLIHTVRGLGYILDNPKESLDFR
jgi:two-component system, OmpR family, response regulator MprA